VKRTLYVLYWLDIVTDAAWGKGEKRPANCVSVGFIIAWPNKRQKHRCYRVAASDSATGVGNVTTIPEGCVTKVESLCKLRTPK